MFNLYLLINITTTILHMVLLYYLQKKSDVKLQKHCSY